MVATDSNSDSIDCINCNTTRPKILQEWNNYTKTTLQQQQQQQKKKKKKKKKKKTNQFQIISEESSEEGQKENCFLC